MEVAGYSRLEAFVIVRDDKLDTFEPAGLEGAEKLLVSGLTLGISAVSIPRVSP